MKRRLISVCATAAMVVGGAAAAWFASAGTANAVGGPDALSSTTNLGSGTSPGDGYCLNGGPNAVHTDPTNCNNYQAKEDVWLSGLGTAGLDDGTYFFYVSSPGDKDNLSDPDTSLASRTFTVTGGVASYNYAGAGQHSYDSGTGKLQVAPFEDTPNHGGVYILHLCFDNGSGKVQCKNDAFKVKGSTLPPPSGKSAPGLEKTASATHHRDINWDILKLVDGKSTEAFNQVGPANLNYSVAATKNVVYDRYGVTGTITATNTNIDPLPVTISETGILPAITNSSCTLDLPTNPTSVSVDLDAGSVATPSTYAVNYTCTFDPANPPDSATQYVNTASVSFDIGNGTESVDALSDLFTFPVVTEDGDPETINVTDPNAPLAAGFPKTASDTTTWTYSQPIFNNDCLEYDNTATIVENSELSGTVVEFCGPNVGGLTMGWWQNKNGQALLKSNLGSACGTVNNYLPSTVIQGALSYLPDAYQQNKSFTAQSFNYLSGQCQTTGVKSYLPTFDLNVFTAANAAGTGTMMVEGQWLTTAMDTAGYPVYTSAGRPTLSAGEKVQIPSALVSGLGLASCDTIGNLLTQAAGQYSTYSASKSSGVTPALITLLNAINNNQAITCI